MAYEECAPIFFFNFLIYKKLYLCSLEEKCLLWLMIISKRKHLLKETFLPKGLCRAQMAQRPFVRGSALP